MTNRCDIAPPFLIWVVLFCLLTGRAHVSQFVAICLLESILLFFILFTCKFCPVSESVAICLSRINIFVTSSPAKQSSCHHREKTLCNHSWSPPNEQMSYCRQKHICVYVCVCVFVYACARMHIAKVCSHFCKSQIREGQCFDVPHLKYNLEM